MPMLTSKLLKTSKRVKDKAIDKVLTPYPSQLLVKIVKDELTELMGGDPVGIDLMVNQQ